MPGPGNMRLLWVSHCWALSVKGSPQSWHQIFAAYQIG
jgi:hypothetical protein